MIYLLDINVLIALGDPAHVHGAAALRFFETSAVSAGWATCPFTENGFLRIFGGQKYPGGPGSPQGARVILDRLLSIHGHEFWSDDLSLLDTQAVPKLPESHGVTDVYLLALAGKHGGRLATFDHRIDPSTLPRGREALFLIPHS